MSLSRADQSFDHSHSPRRGFQRTAASSGIALGLTPRTRSGSDGGARFQFFRRCSEWIVVIVAAQLAFDLRAILRSMPLARTAAPQELGRICWPRSVWPRDHRRNPEQARRNLSAAVELDAQRLCHVDVAIDQGGRFETSRPTHTDPNLRGGGSFITASPVCPELSRTTSQALNHATLPFGLALASEGITAALENSHLRAGVNVYRVA